MLSVTVIIATKGRPELVSTTQKLLAAQTYPLTEIIYSVSDVSDVPEGAADSKGVKFVYGAAGLTKQRNRAIAELGETVDVVVFFDDDFFPAKSWVINAVKLFEQNEDLVGITGTVIADGASGPGISTAAGLDIVHASENLGDEDSAQPPKPIHSLYGCNMAFRFTALKRCQFDERLPAYGWQEDQDISSEVARLGRIVKSRLSTGVHLGSKSGRIAGKKLGISQVINPLYLLKKNNIRPSHAARLVLGNIGANLVRSISPESYIDRRGRLVGNLIGLKYVILGRIDPGLISEF